MRVVCISDTHSFHNRISIPEGDVLLFSGDMCGRSTLEDVRRFNQWLGTLPYPKENIVVVAGNHDRPFEDDPKKAKSFMTNCTYLQDELYVVNGLKIWGSPWQPEFFNWAFNLKRGPEIKEKWDLIPDGIDILITHGPPFGIGDKAQMTMQNVGCVDLLDAVKRVNPKMHLFGHIHEGYGVFQKKDMDTVFVNASICTLQYKPIQLPLVFEYKEGKFKLLGA